MMLCFGEDAVGWISDTERLGGWAVVVFIVIWLTKRMERVIGEQAKAIEELAKGLTNRVGELRETNFRMLERQTNHQEREEKQLSRLCGLMETLIRKGGSQ